MTIFEVFMLCMTAISGVGMPLVLLQMSRQDRQRNGRFDELENRLTHLDTCFDSLRLTVSGKGVTREDFANYRIEMQTEATRIRSAITAEIALMNTRILRLEEPYFGKKS